ncbi:MAG: hypothetical protein ABW128_01585 [Rhizorhabdus sp.]
MARKPDPAAEDPVTTEDTEVIPGPDGPIPADDYAAKIDEVGEPFPGNVA